MYERIIPKNRADIIIVDDNLDNLNILLEVLKNEEFLVRPAISGKAALKLIEKSLPDLILMDINMPEMSGFETCLKLKEDEKTQNIPIIFVSALSNTIEKVRAFKIGGVDYINKPYQFEEIRARINTHLKIRNLQLDLENHNAHLEKLVKLKIREIYESQMATILALAKLTESRDDATGKHLERVQEFSRLLAVQISKNRKYRGRINSSYIENIFKASPMHDIGKVGIPDNILLKAGKLDSNEFEIMKNHTTIGANTLEAVRRQYPKNSFINMGIGIARSHHERWDGTGYPDGLSGNNIPLSARIMALVDFYDAMRSRRCYKPEHSHEETYDIIIKSRGTHFDPAIVEAFKKVHTRFNQNTIELN